ncbi:hypothetical protein EDB85DRAFT_2148636 [Lactarius pseudohatsudake]|nr:hypothetical protein EDB85DRAFT_2148636 [Lactarius pseudohatsudake]
MSSSSSPEDGQSETLVGLNSVKAEYASGEHPHLAIPGQLAYSPGTRNPMLLSSSFSSSDIGMPSSSIHLDTNTASLLQVPAPASALEPITGVLMDLGALAPSALTHPKFNLFVFCPLSTSLPLQLTDLAHGPRYILHPEFNLFVFCPLSASPPLQPTDLGASF